MGRVMESGSVELSEGVEWLAPLKTLYLIPDVILASGRCPPGVSSWDDAAVWAFRLFMKTSTAAECRYVVLLRG